MSPPGKTRGRGRTGEKRRLVVMSKEGRATRTRVQEREPRAYIKNGKKEFHQEKMQRSRYQSCFVLLFSVPRFSFNVCSEGVQQLVRHRLALCKKSGLPSCRYSPKSFCRRSALRHRQSKNAYACMSIPGGQAFCASLEDYDRGGKKELRLACTRLALYVRIHMTEGDFYRVRDSQEGIRSNVRKQTSRKAATGCLFRNFSYSDLPHPSWGEQVLPKFPKKKGQAG